jgi:hypothetical protein
MTSYQPVPQPCYSQVQVKREVGNNPPATTVAAWIPGETEEACITRRLAHYRPPAASTARAYDINRAYFIVGCHAEMDRARLALRRSALSTDQNNAPRMMFERLTRSGRVYYSCSCQASW